MRVPAVLFIALVVAAIGFVAGRASVPDTASGPAIPAETNFADSPVSPSPVSDRTSASDPRVELLRALEQPGPARDHAVRRAMLALLTAEGVAALVSELARTDMDRAIDAVDAMDDPELRRSAALGLLLVAETDAEAIRLGQGYGFDRDAVLELRERGLEGVSFGPGERVTVRRFGFRVDLEPGAN